MPLRIFYGAKLQVFTIAFRKVSDQDMPGEHLPDQDLPLPLRDNWGTPLASGLYYVVITPSPASKQAWLTVDNLPRLDDRYIGKLLILR